MAVDADEAPEEQAPEIDAAGIAQLARKYRALAALRRARAAGEPIPERGVFKALAAEFPGALNELDNLPLETIDARLEALGRALSGGAPARWMAWMHRYHALMRAALYVKIRVSRRAELTGDDVAALAAKATAHAGTPVDAAFVEAVKAPPAGRITRVVLDRLAASFAATPEEIRRACFPGRRGG